MSLKSITTLCDSVEGTEEFTLNSEFQCDNIIFYGELEIINYTLHCHRTSVVVRPIFCRCICHVYYRLWLDFWHHTAVFWINSRLPKLVSVTKMGHCLKLVKKNAVFINLFNGIKFWAQRNLRRTIVVWHQFFMVVRIVWQVWRLGQFFTVKTMFLNKWCSMANKLDVCLF